MKTKRTKFLGLFLAVLVFSFLNGCKKENLETTTPNQQLGTEKTASLDQIDEPKEMMTLSAIAMRFHQGGREALAKEMLAMPNLATKNNWEMVWYAFNEKKSVQMMVVKHKLIPNTYAVVAKGQKEDNIYSLYQGINVFGKEPWPWVLPGQAEPTIAQGARALANILFEDLRADAPSLNVTNGTLADVFNSITNSWDRKQTLNVYSAGHSLGGANAVMMGAYLHTFLSQVGNVPDKMINLRIYDFAGPNLFRPDFVNYYNNLKKDTHINVKEYFYLIRNDVVCNFFPQNMDGLYNAFPWGWTMKPVIKSFITGFNASLSAASIEYGMVGSEADGSRIWMTNKTDPKLYDLPEKIYFIDGYTKYYGYYHFTDNYMRTLDTPLVPEVKDGKIIPLTRTTSQEDLHFVPTEAQVQEFLQEMKK
ncbi:MAG: hypothetical protein ACEPOV_09350 [Hyphomicrobiales bacterium]